MTDMETTEKVDGMAALRAFLDEDDHRINSVMEKLEACYLGSKRDDEIAAHLKRLIINSLKKRYPKRPEGEGNRRAGVGFVVVAESGAGKTAALEKALSEHPAFPGYGIPGSGCLFISVLVPSPTTLAQLGNATLEAMGYKTDKPLRENEAWKRVRQLLHKKRVMFVHFDDIHNVLREDKKREDPKQAKKIQAKEIKKIQATLRNLLTSRIWPVQLVLSGIHESLDLFSNDQQLKRRMKFVMFDDLDPAVDAGWMTEVAKEFAKKAGLKYEERPGSMIVERLCHAAVYQFGLAIELLRDGIESALRADRKVFGIFDLQVSYADRTAQPAELNVFVSPAWKSIDPTVIFDCEKARASEWRRAK